MHFSHAALKKSNIQPIEHLITEPFPKLFQSDAPLIVSILLFYFHVFWISLCSKILHYASCQYVRGYIYIWSVNMSLAGASRLAAFFVSSHHKWYIFKTFCQFKNIFQDYVSFRCTPSSCFWMRNTSNWQLTALICISFAYYTSLHIINCVVLYNFYFFILMWNFIKKDKTRF